MLHALLGVPSLAVLTGHPKVGASFEGFAVEQICAALSLRDPFFWATHAGAELDLLLTSNGKRYGFVVYPGDESYALDSRIEALPVGEIPRLPGRPEFAPG